MKKETVKLCTVDFPTKLGKCDVIVEECDVNTPYFVVKNDDTEIKICAYKPKYFGENDYILNNEEKEVLDTTINQIHKFGLPWDGKDTHWQWAAIMWGELNEDAVYEYKDKPITEIPKPNYLEL